MKKEGKCMLDTQNLDNSVSNANGSDGLPCLEMIQKAWLNKIKLG